MAVKIMETLRRRTGGGARHGRPRRRGARGRRLRRRLRVGLGGRRRRVVTCRRAARSTSRSPPTSTGPSGPRSTTLAKLFPAYPELRKMLDESLAGRGRELRPRRQAAARRPRRRSAPSTCPDDVRASRARSPPPTPAAAGAAAGAADDTEFVGVVDIAEGKEDAVTALLVKGGATKAGRARRGDLLHAARRRHGRGRRPTARSSSPTARASSTRRSTRTRRAATRPSRGSDKFTDALGKLPADVFGQAYIDVGALRPRRPAPPRRSSSSSASTTTRTPSSRRRSRPSPRARA